MKGRSIWGIAQDLASGTHPKPPPLRIHEKLVFGTLSVDEALERLAMGSDSSRDERENDEEDGRKYTPLEVLGCLIVRERVKKHMGRLFVQVVAANAACRREGRGVGGGGVMVNDEEEEESYREEEAARRMTVDAARELGGSVERLGRAFERVWKTTTCAVVVDDDELYSYFGVGLEDEKEGKSAAVGGDKDEDEIKALFTALVLYRQAFGGLQQQQRLRDPSSSLLSPPPSPTIKGNMNYARMLLELRKALGNRVFEDNVDDDNTDDAEGEGDDMEGGAGGGCASSRVLGLEDARDRVVDMIMPVDVERRGTY